MNLVDNRVRPRGLTLLSDRLIELAFFDPDKEAIMFHKITAAACFAVLLAAFPPQAQAWVRVGINLGFPIYAGPYYGPYGYPYYGPYPYYVGPQPVYVVPSSPTVVQPAPAYQPAPGYQPVPVAQPPQTRSQSYAEPLQQPRLLDGQQAGDANRYMQQLSNQEERVRSDAALELGRMKAQPAIDSLSAMLTSDPSPVVRETAARALGLIGSARGLNALQNAAQADNDRDVRRSAQFAAEVIRANLRKD